MGAGLRAWDIAVSPDGVLFVSDNARIRAVIDGKYVTVAGTGVTPLYDGTDGENGPATQARIDPQGIAFGPDGSLYIADTFRILRVDTDGRLVRIAGTGKRDTDFRRGDGGSALDAGIAGVGVAVDRDGNVYFTDSEVVRKITTDGVIHLFAGSRNRSPLLPVVADGALATAGRLGKTSNGLSVMADGSVLIGDVGDARVRIVRPDGIISTLAGTGQTSGPLQIGGSLARGMRTSYPWDVETAPDGSVYVLDYNANIIRRLEPTLPAPTTRSALRIIAASDGATADIFENGRHTKTVSTLTNAALFTFEYDPNGLLTAVKDVDGRVTRIERGADTFATAIVAPSGQRTALTIADGNLTKIETPANATFRFGYNTSRLLTSVTDRRDAEHRFTYDDNGLLLKDSDPEGGSVALVRTDASASDVEVTRKSAEGRVSRYRIETLADGSSRRTTVGPDQLTVSSAYGGDGKNSRTLADGLALSNTNVGDARFAMMAPFVTSATTKTPAGLTLTEITSRDAQLANPSDPLSLIKLTDTRTVNGKRWASVFSPATRTFSLTSPLGRITTRVVDARGHLVLSQAGTLTPATFSYTPEGRLETASRGARRTSYAYDGRGRLASVTDALGRVNLFEYDSSDRVIAQTLPDSRVVAFSYDVSGNVTSITPPSRPAHSFEFSAVDLASRYSAAGANTTTYKYNRDRQLMLVTRPDSKTISFTYDSAGRLSLMTTPTGVTQFTFNATTGTLDSMGNTEGTIAYTYDGGLIKNVTSTGLVSGSVAYSYDNNFRVVSENGIAYSYDSDGFLATAGALTLQRDAASGLLSGTALGLTSDAWTYNAFGEPLSYTAAYNGGQILREQTTRDDLGRILERTETLNGIATTFVYGYDKSGHLETVTRDNLLVARYGYDPNGNRVAKTTPAAAEAATYDDEDRLVTYAGATFTHTAAGELRSISTTAGLSEYEYDVLGNLTHVKLANGTVIDYIVDALNRRVGKKVNGVLVRGWVYSGPLRIVAELDGSGNVVSRFVYGSKANVPDYLVQGATTYRIISDHLGSPRLVVNITTGSVVQSIGYDEFGVVLTDSNPGFQPFGFAGGLYDTDTRLSRFGFRDYDATIGRWTAKDPIGFAGRRTDFYTYAGNDPVNTIDSTGLIGFGIVASESVEGGAGKVGIGQTGSAGVGFFADGVGPSSHQEVGAFASWGGTNSLDSYSPQHAYPNRCDDAAVVGAYAGGGVGWFVTNANHASDLNGPFHTASLNFGWAARVFSLQLSWGTNAAGDSIWSFGYGGPGTLGVGYGFSASHYDTNTVTASTSIN